MVLQRVHEAAFDLDRPTTKYRFATTVTLWLWFAIADTRASVDVEIETDVCTSSEGIGIAKLGASEHRMPRRKHRQQLL